MSQIRKDGRRAGWAALAALLGALATAGAWGAPALPVTIVNPGGANPAPVDDSNNTVVGSEAMLERFGIKPLGIRVSAAGYVLDFRYRVVDAEKAVTLLDPQMAPYVLVRDQGVRLGVPVTSKLGALRSSTRQLKADRNYFMLFTNPGRYVQSGDRVQVVIGSVTIDDLTVL